ncbi:rhodanese-like domain-containing protein [Paenibacillus sp. UNC451MF]|uniref:rhodanese-like domain-containing protein n=1 Tax=Paenibacillus sp. UNC451MF TaxID=1449063 RepID=UPI00068FA909|nr:rhodanese-like domain-containing protein [Paenibacillus sp. UNC451MF]
MKWLVLIVLLFIYYMWFRPVKGLKYMDSHTLCEFMKNSEDPVILLDTRDSVDYYAGHLEGAVHISLGRLPYVKKKELKKEAQIILVSDSKYRSKKAARILKKSGFSHLSALNEGKPSYCSKQPIGI